jgi:TolB protein
LKVAFASIQVTVNYPDPWQYQPALGVIALDGTGLEEHGRESQLNGLAWSPGGDQLLLDRLGPSGGAGVSLTSLDGTDLGPVTPAFTGSPDWSSTGQIAFVRSSSDPDCHPHCYDIWVMRLGEAPRRLTYRGGYSPSWSPHGTKLAFVRLAEGRQQVYLVGRDGRGLRRLTGRGGSGPSWSPDGRWIAFTRNGDLYVVRTDGSGRRRLVDGMLAFGEGPHVTGIDWQSKPRR